MNNSTFNQSYIKGACKFLEKLQVTNRVKINYPSIYMGLGKIL